MCAILFDKWFVVCTYGEPCHNNKKNNHHLFTYVTCLDIMYAGLLLYLIKIVFLVTKLHYSCIHTFSSA